MTSFRPRNLSECVGALWTRRWLVLGLASVVLLSCYLVIRRIPDVYESRAVVVVADPQEDGLVTSGYVAAVREQMRSRATLEPVIRKHDLYRPILERAGMDVAVEQMRRALAVETTERRERLESLSVAFRYSDPETTRAVLDDLVAGFEAANLEMRRRAEAEMGSLSAEIGALDGQLDSLDTVRAASARAVSAAQAEYDLMLEAQRRREATLATVESLASRQQALTAQVAGLRQQVKDQEELVASAARAPGAASGAAGVLLVRRAELNAQLAEYAKQYTEKNPKVTAAREQLAAVERQIAKIESGEAGAAPPNTAEAAELRGLKRDLARLETELDITSQEIERRRASAPAVPLESALARSAGTPVPAEADGGYDRLRLRYQALLNRQDSLERAIPTALAGGIFRLVDPPATPDTPVGPSRVLLALFALSLALGAGLLVAAVLEARRLVRIQDDLDVSYFLGAPVLAAIPETLTPGEQHARRTGRVLRGVAFAALAAVLVPALFALFSVVPVFELLAQR